MSRPVAPTPRTAAIPRSRLTARCMLHSASVSDAYGHDEAPCAAPRPSSGAMSDEAGRNAIRPRAETHEARSTGSRRAGFRTALTTLAGLTSTDSAAWRVLAAQHPMSGPLVDQSWIESWTRAFVPPEPVLLCAWEDGQLAGLAPLQRISESWHGRRLAVLQSLTNAESFRFDFLARERRVDILEGLWRAVALARRWDVIRIQHLPEGSPTLTAGLAVAHELGWRPVLRRTFLTPWLPLLHQKSWDEELKGRFKSNLRRRERRLTELGEVTFGVSVAGSTLRQALDT